MSIEPFKRIFWIILDGMGIEHMRLFLGSGRFLALAKVEKEGYLGACAPSSPACQTPPALLTLFAGAEPRESGIWGYQMPDPRHPMRSISGFSAPTKSIRTIWEELSQRGRSISLMNVAFRNDPVWSGQMPGLDFGYDGYRLWERAHVFPLQRSGVRIEFHGIELALVRSKHRVLIRKGSRTLAELPPLQWRRINLTRASRASASFIDGSHVAIAPFTRPLVRGGFHPASAGDDFIDFNLFRPIRGLNRGRAEEHKIPVDAEMAPVELGMNQKQSLMIDAIKGTSSSLVIGYFPLVDELNHASFDLLEGTEPDPRVLTLFMECARLVDDLVRRVMAVADRDTLVMISSDHGASAFRNSLHLNEVFARCGLVARSAEGYDFQRSLAYYHASECGLVLGRRGADRMTALACIRRGLDLAREQAGVRIGMEEGRLEDPFLAFVHPLSDSYLASRPPKRGEGIIDKSRSGGQHISSLTPTPWIQSMLGIWSPRTDSLAGALDGIPTANRMLKDFIIRALEGD